MDDEHLAYSAGRALRHFCILLLIWAGLCLAVFLGGGLLLEQVAR